MAVTQNLLQAQLLRSSFLHDTLKIKVVTFIHYNDKFQTLIVLNYKGQLTEHSNTLNKVTYSNGLEPDSIPTFYCPIKPRKTS